MSIFSRQGVSLVELLVALVLLDLAGVAGLSAILTMERIGRRAAAGAAEDPARWYWYRSAETAAACADTNSSRSVSHRFDSTPIRPALEVAVLCGG